MTNNFRISEAITQHTMQMYNFYSKQPPRPTNIGPKNTGFPLAFKIPAGRQSSMDRTGAGTARIPSLDHFPIGIIFLFDTIHESERLAVSAETAIGHRIAHIVTVAHQGEAARHSLPRIGILPFGPGEPAGIPDCPYSAVIGGQNDAEARLVGECPPQIPAIRRCF